MALDEPEEGLTNFNSKGIEVFMHSALADQLQQFGGVSIDFIDEGPDRRGFVIATNNKPAGHDCKGCNTDSGCSSEEDNKGE
ncbi:MAG: hypothetical protein V3V99_04180 [candidate division Zixibacteria bacterium]